MATSQTEKANRFRALHERCFVIANAWDAGSARILAGVGFAALATSSGAAAGMLGRRDGMITREESLVHARTVAEATDLPVSADLEKGFGDPPMRPHRRLRWPANRPGRRLDRGCHRRSAEAAVRSWPRDGAHRGRRCRGAQGTVRLHTDGARGELHPRQPRPGRHDPASAGVRGSRRRRADGAGPARPRSRADCVLVRCRSRSTSWRGSRGSRSPWQSLRRPA